MYTHIHMGLTGMAASFLPQTPVKQHSTELKQAGGFVLMEENLREKRIKRALDVKILCIHFLQHCFLEHHREFHKKYRTGNSTQCVQETSSVISMGGLLDDEICARKNASCNQGNNLFGAICGF